MNISKQRKLILISLLPSFLIFFPFLTYANEIEIVKPTEFYLNQFAKVYNDIKTTLYGVDLLKRSCGKSVGGVEYGQDNKRYESVFLPKSNRFRYTLDHSKYIKTPDSIEKGVSPSQLNSCPQKKAPENKMGSVILNGDNVIGWIFVSTDDFCHIPVFTFPHSGGCYYHHCDLTIPSGTEVLFISLYKEISEKIRLKQKSIQTIDNANIYSRRSCLELD